MIRRVLVGVAVVLFVLSAGLAWSLEPLEELGKELFFDMISSPDSMACAACHAPSTGFTGPIPGINRHGAVYRGAVPQRFGNRKPPSAAYAAVSPLFNYDDGEDLFFGGNFWDGRATGWELGNPSADQALGPFLNPVEQNNPSQQAVCEQVAAARYAPLFEEVWGPGSLDCSEAAVGLTYHRIGLSIAAFEDSSEVNQYSSKFDYFLAGEVELTEQEEWGRELFEAEDQGNCAACHLGPFFTDFTFDNVGVPKNPENPFYSMDTVFLDDGSPINPLGMNWVDMGLGGFLRSLADPSNQGWRTLPFVTTNVADLSNQELSDFAEENDGKHKVPTLRNVDQRPGNSFPKAFGHNGFFKSLWGIVHFYNTRDVLESCEDLGLMDATEMVALANNCWPAPEVAANLNRDELGNLGLSDEEEKAIVAFLKTLSDGYRPPRR